VPDRDQAAADLIALAVDGGRPDDITCITWIVRCRRPSRQTAGETAGETAWTASTSDAIL
jgi:hypothetical protein